MSEVRYSSRWWVIANLGVGAVVFHLTMEWLFFVTKISFLTPMTWPERLGVLVSAPLPIAAAILVIIGFMGLIATHLPRSRRPLELIAFGLVALVLACALFVMFDNFMTTVFGVTVRTSQRFTRLFWAIVLVLLVFKIHGKISQLIESSRRSNSRAPLLVAMTLFSLVAAATRRSDTSPLLEVGLRTVHRRPNILLIGVDGLLADRLSSYGYDKETAPNLRKLSDGALVCENAFTNSSVTAASTVALLTSKSSQTTGVVGWEQVQRKDIYQHLPGILRSLGYRSAQIGLRQHVDAGDSNLQNGFDEVNLRSMTNVYSRALEKVVAVETAFFIRQVAERLSSRVWYTVRLPQRVISWLPFRESTPTRDIWRDFESITDYDVDTINQATNFVEAAEEPFFVHMFLVGTHAYRFEEESRVDEFREKRPNRYWDTDAYDDAILEADRQLGRLIEALERAGRLDDTVVVFYSDHGPGRLTTRRIPLIFRFPGDEHEHRLRANVQLLDVAPTILGYLEVEKPKWMEGVSILAPPIDRERPIVAVKPNSSFYEAQGFSTQPKVGAVSVISCHSFVEYDNLSAEAESGSLSGGPNSAGQCSGLGQVDMQRLAVSIAKFFD